MTGQSAQPFLRSYITAPEARRVGDVDAAATVHLTVVLRPNDMPAEIGAPVSRAEYATRFATPAAVIDRLSAYARSHGLVVDSADAALHLVHLSGTYAQAQAAFAPENLGVYSTPGGNFVARHGHLSLPADLAPDIVAVMGFDHRPVARPFHRIQPHAAPAIVSYDPAGIAHHYTFPTGVTGAGQTIAVIELGGGYDPADVANYFHSQGVTRTGTLEAVSVGSVPNDPGGEDGADGEVQLDIEIAGAVAPGANIAVYFTSNRGSGFLNAIAAAVHDSQRSPSVITISWGGPESAWPAQDIDAMNQALQAAATLGITVCCASGDAGAEDNSPDGEPSVDFPASSPYVLGCGGTSLPPSGPEVAWNNGSGGGSSGGGYSVHFPRPTWQVGSGDALAAKPGRGVPDVAGNADPATGYNVAVGGRPTVVGGTSAVAPLWAALVALSNQAAGRNAGFVNPALYGNPEAFTDIIQGNNNLYQSGPGWDPVTGLGSPLGAAIAAALGQDKPVA